jgi:hypothetical protein
MFGGFTLRCVPCEECGASVPKSVLAEHVCDRERVVEYLLIRCREEIERFDADLADYLGSPAGRFALWDAGRSRRRPASG